MDTGSIYVHSIKVINYVGQNLCVPINLMSSLLAINKELVILSIFVLCFCRFSSVQFSRSVVSDSLRFYELQHARPPCLSPTPGVHSDSCPSSQWCHPVISSSVIPLSSCHQSLPHQSLFQWVNSSHEVAKVLEFQL